MSQHTEQETPMNTTAQYLRARSVAVGEPEAVITAALFMRGTEPDAEFLRDVKRRVEAWETAQVRAELRDRSLP